MDKFRVVQRPNNERNFHIFYQLFTDDKIKQKFDLSGTIENYVLLSTTGSGGNSNKSSSSHHHSHSFDEYDNDSSQPMSPASAKSLDINEEGNKQHSLFSSLIDDAAKLKSTRDAMDIIGITPEEQLTLFALLASLLHLGNITIIETANEVALINNVKSLELAAKHLHIDAQVLTLFLTMRTGFNSSKSSSTVDQSTNYMNQREATLRLQALIVHVYSRIFNYVVKKINQAIDSISNSIMKHLNLGLKQQSVSASASTTGSLSQFLGISIVDLFGFESFSALDVEKDSEEGSNADGEDNDNEQFSMNIEEQVSAVNKTSAKKSIKGSSSKQSQQQQFQQHQSQLLPSNNNGIEQMLINYCSERLHQIYIHNALLQEYEEYRNESINIFSTNSGMNDDKIMEQQQQQLEQKLEQSKEWSEETVKLFDGLPYSIFTIFNDTSSTPINKSSSNTIVSNYQSTRGRSYSVSNSQPAADVKQFINQLKKQLNINHSFVWDNKTSVVKNCFQVKHTKGMVEYQISNETMIRNDMLESPMYESLMESLLLVVPASSSNNNNSLNSSSGTSNIIIKDILQQSTGVQQLQQDNSSNNSSSSTYYSNNKSLVSAFKLQLDYLISNFITNSTSNSSRSLLHVKCIRPFVTQAPLSSSSNSSSFKKSSSQPAQQVINTKLMKRQIQAIP